MARAIFNNTTIARSDDVVTVEGRVYFPVEAVKMEYLQKSGNTATCHWKGNYEYFDVSVDGEISHDAAWIYPDPMDAAKKIKGRVGFWKDIEVFE